MQTVTWLDIVTHVEREMDLQEESLIDEDMMMDYGNAAIDFCESKIHQLYEDYFKTSYSLPMVVGTSSYAMPTDIYANKIRFVQFTDGTTDYKVCRIKTKNIVNVETSDDYMFDIQHPTAVGGVRFVLYPTSRESTSSQIVLWYIRNSNRVTSDTSVIDIPEYVSVLEAFIKHRCALKLRDPMLVVKYEEELVRETKDMVAMLGDMVADDDVMMEPDLSFYDDMA